MTAISERDTTSAGLASPAEVSVFLRAAREHSDQPGDPQGRTRAGLNAVLAARHIERASIQSGLFNVSDEDAKERLKETGWQVVGVGSNPATGAPMYVLERAPLADDDA